MYTCCKRAVSNSSSLYTLFYSVIYNSVATTIDINIVVDPERFFADPDHTFNIDATGSVLVLQI